MSLSPTFIKPQPLLQTISESQNNQITMNEINKLKDTVDIQTFFEMAQPSFNRGKQKKESDVLIVSSFLSYGKEFVRMLRELSGEGHEEGLKNIALNGQYERWPANRVVIRTGNEALNFYLILKGKVDVFLGHSVKTPLKHEEYMRFIALCLLYKEYDVGSKAINNNFYTTPIEIIDPESDVGHKGRITKTYNSSRPIIKLTVEQVMKFLTDIEGKDFGRYHKEKSPKAEMDDNIEGTGDEYVNRGKRYKLQPELSADEPENENGEEYTIYEYSNITSLHIGQKFGDIAGSEQFSKRTATVITASECHFGCLNKKKYSLSLKDAFDQHRRSILLFIANSSLFKGFPMRVLQNKFYNNFIHYKTEKNREICPAHVPNSNILIFKTGEYELNITTTLSRMNDIILFLFNRLKLRGDQKDNLQNEIIREIKDLLKQRKKVEQLLNGNEIHKAFKNEYSEIFSVKLLGVSSPDVISGYEMEYDNGCLGYSVKCVSPAGEYFTVDKAVHKEMCKIDPRIKRHSMNINYWHNIKIIQRLLIIRENKIKMYFQRLTGFHSGDKLSTILDDFISNKAYLNKKDMEGGDSGRAGGGSTGKLLRNASLPNTAETNKVFFGKLKQSLPKEIKQLRLNNGKKMTLGLPLFPGTGRNNSIVATNRKTKRFSSHDLYRETLKSQSKIESRNDKPVLKRLRFHSSQGELLKKKKNSTVSCLKQSIFDNDGGKIKMNDGLGDSRAREKSSLFKNETNLTITSKTTRENTGRMVNSSSNCTINIETYQMRKQEKYINERNVYLIKSTRDIFMRNKMYLHFKKGYCGKSLSK